MKGKSVSSWNQDITPENVLLGVFNKETVAKRYMDKSRKEKWGHFTKILNYDEDDHSDEEMSDPTNNRDADGDVEMRDK